MAEQEPNRPKIVLTKAVQIAFILLEYLESRWKETTARAQGDKLLIPVYWEILNKNHSQTHRTYHNWNHIHSLLKLSQKFKSELENPTMVDYAIFYHDAIYIPKRNNNEEKSALLAKQHLEKIDSTYATKVATMILATKKHELSQDHDTNFLLDFDLAIIGSPWLDYERYTQHIRKEYSIYPDFLYRPGRKKVLQSFLDQSHIFKTELFQTQYEHQARLNIQREINTL